MDLGIWGVWYDLDEANRSEFLDWAHTTYLPRLRSMDGISWVAHYANEGGGPAMDHLASNVIGRTDEDIGDGSQFVILAGAPSPHSFFTPDLPRHDWPSDIRKMLDLRKGMRQAVFVETHRVAGPECETLTPGGPPGPYIQMGSFQMASVSADFTMAQWYARYRLPFVSSMPGSIRTRKFVGVAGWAKHAVMYEFVSKEARMEHFEVAHETKDLDSREWHREILRETRHSPGSPVIGPRLWPPLG